jgi:hypothetical protein
MTSESEHRSRLSLTVLIALCLSLAYVGLQCELGWARFVPPDQSRPFFRDTDDFMRMERVRRIQTGESGLRIHFLREHGYPDGAAIHWTMPQDLLLLGLSRLFGPASASVDAARARAGLWVGPLLEAGVLVWLAWWGTLALGARAAAAGLLLFALSGAAAESFGLAHPDHHGLILACSVVGLCAAVRAGQLLRGAAAGSRPFVWAALSSLALSVGLWTAVEAAAMWAVVSAGWALAALTTRDRALRAALRRIGLAWAGLGLCFTLLFHVLENGSGQLLTPALDRISILWVLLWGVSGLWFALGIGAAAEPDAERGGRSAAERRRWVRGLSLGLVLPLLWLAALRSVAPSPGAEASLTMRRWFELIAEFHPLGSGPGANLWVEVSTWLGLTVWALPPALIWLWLAGRDPRAVRLHWLSSAVAFTGLALAQQRWVGAAAFVAAMVVGQGLGALSGYLGERVARKAGRAGVRAPASAALCIAAAALLGSAGLLAPLGGDSQRGRQAAAFADDARRVRELTDWLNRGGRTDDDEGPAVMAPWWTGPQILYETGRPVPASPYHGNLEGIVDSARFYLLESDAEPAALMRARCAGWVIVPSHSGFALQGRYLLGQSPDRTGPGDRLAGMSRERFDRILQRRLQGAPSGFPPGFVLAAAGAPETVPRLPPYRLFRFQDEGAAGPLCPRR